MIHLYVKRHDITGLLYFGKTATRCPYSYLGSGKYWMRHLKVHGKCVTTLTVWSFGDEELEQCREFALRFSAENDVVNSPLWANLQPENGVDGALPGRKQAPEHVAARTGALIGRKRGPIPEARRHKISTALKGRKVSHSDETKFKISLTKRGADNPNYGKVMSEEAKLHLAKLNLGKRMSEDTKAKMKKAAQQRETRKRLEKGSVILPIWTISRERLVQILAQASSKAEACRMVGMPGSYQRALRTRLEQEGLCWLK